MDETLQCDHSSESYLAVLLCGTVYCVVQCGSKILDQNIVWLGGVYKVVLTLKFFGWNLHRGHLYSESYLAVLLCGTVYCVVQCGSKILDQNIVWLGGVYKVVLTLKFFGWNLHRGHLYSKMPTFILLIENIQKLFPWKI